MRTLVCGIVLSLLVAVGVSCRPSGGGGVEGGKEVGEEEMGTAYRVTGTVHRVDLDQRSLVIAHEAIPGYMMAMTMPFEVRDTNEMVGVEVGDRLVFRMKVTQTDGWIEGLEKVGHDPTVAPELRKGPRVVPLVDPLYVGDVVPDCTLTNQFGEPFQLHSLRGQVVGLTFFFTRCPYPTFCPRTTAQFGEVAEALAQDATGMTNWHLLQISFDPDYDSPKALEAYAEQHGYDPVRWTFATADMPVLDEITEQFGCEFGRDGEFYSHNIRTVVLNPQGEVSLMVTGNTWQVETLVQAMRDAADLGE
ncbi:MAG: SCO family protein [Limisphaerales bacterium]